MGTEQQPHPASNGPDGWSGDALAATEPAAAIEPSAGPEPSALTGACWPDDSYRRAELPETILQFGTGMLLRALPAAFVDAANRAGARAGRIVVVQSTTSGVAATINAQDGLFTLLERGIEDGASVERARLVGSLSRALLADADWSALLDVAASPDLRVIVSNVTEAGFRPDGFPVRLTALLHDRFARLGATAPPLAVIPTELVDDNGARLAAMVDAVAGRDEATVAFRAWLGEHVRFCSSLVDRITTGAPAADERPALERRLGYRDALLTVTEPYALWAVEGEPELLRRALPIDEANPGAVFARSIGLYRQRKIRLLNGAHTALAPLAILAGVATVRDAVEHPLLGALLDRILFDEIIPATDVPVAEATAFARSVIDRFRNPGLDHPWRTIATNQTAKLRLRVAPSIVEYASRQGRAPDGLALGLAAHLRYLRPVVQEAPGRGAGWWRGVRYPIDDVDLPAMARHWSVATERAEAPLSADVLARVAESALADEALWGTDLGRLAGVRTAVTALLIALEREGTEPVLHRVLGGEPRPAASARA